MRLRCISVSPSAGACIVFPALCTGACASCLASLTHTPASFHSFTEPRRRSRRAARRRGPRERRGGVDQVHRGGEPRDHEPPRQECDHDAPRGPHDRCDADPSAMGECSEKDDGRRGRREEGEGAQWRKRMGVRHVSPVKLHAMCGLFCGSTRRTRRARAHQTTRQLSPPTNAMSISKHRRYPKPIPHTTMLPPPGVIPVPGLLTLCLYLVFLLLLLLLLRRLPGREQLFSRRAGVHRQCQGRAMEFQR